MNLIKKKHAISHHGTIRIPLRFENEDILEKMTSFQRLNPFERIEWYFEANFTPYRLRSIVDISQTKRANLWNWIGSNQIKTFTFPKQKQDIISSAMSRPNDDKPESSM